MTKNALIIGGTGQIGWAAAERLLSHGWDVTVASRTGDAVPDATPLALDRDDTTALLSAARGRDLVLDTVAYTPTHGSQLAALAGSVGSLVVISTASVYVGANGSYLDVAGGPLGFPDYPPLVTEEHPTVDNDEQTYSPLKAAMERVLFATEGLPVSILRPGAIHGPHAQFLREWFFAKRALDGRPHAVLAYDGDSRFGTSSTANIAELVRLCAEHPGVRALNTADEEALSSREIGETVFRVLGHDAEIVGMPGPARDDGLGDNPWGVPGRFEQSMVRARDELGYVPVATYEEAIVPALDAMIHAVRRAEASGRSWSEAFPKYLDRYGAQTWFPYDAEDAFVAAR